jgi:2-dehydro-3-deoxygalactonokinase
LSCNNSADGSWEKWRLANPSMIGVDWGTSRLRAMLMDMDGATLSQHEADAGILAVGEGGFPDALRQALADLRAPSGLPIVLSGMITSRQGWHELPYLDCPADAAALAAAVYQAEEPGLARLHFITGLVSTGSDGAPDVMRGEETQIIGQDDLQPDEGVVLPGTHSKWVVVEDGCIQRFTTFMTGELFAVLKGHSILGRLMAAGPVDDDAFARGVRLGLDGKGLIGRLFSARTLPLTGGLAATGVADYLSGLLIGSEIAEAERPARVVVIGSHALAERYTKALAIAGIAHRPGRADAAARGQWRIANAAGLIG